MCDDHFCDFRFVCKKTTIYFRGLQKKKKKQYVNIDLIS